MSGIRPGRLLPLLLFGWLLTAASFLAAEEFGEITIEALPPMFERIPARSYFSRSFRIVNRGASAARIALELSALSDRGNNALQVRRSLVIPPGAIQTVELYAPGSNFVFYGQEVKLRLFIDNREYENALLIRSSYAYGDQVSVLYSGSVPVEMYRNLGYFEPEAAASHIPVAQWGRKFRDYSGITRIYLAGGDRLPPEVAAALDQWVRLGGILTTVLAPEDPWPGARPEPAEGVESREQGFGRLIICRPIRLDRRAEIETLAQETRAGRYRHNIERKIDLEAAGAPLDLRQGTQPFAAGPGLIRDAMPLPIQQLPLQKLFFVMLVFVLLIGPVNYWLLRKKRREPWILITTPVISLVFCVLVIVFITFNEGWHSRGRAFGVTLLDQTTRQAVTRAWFDLYAPIAPAAGFTYDSNDALVIWNHGRMALEEDTAQHYLSSLLQPRVPLYVMLERAEARREQLRIFAAGPEVIGAVNGLGGAIRNLLLVGPDGRIHEAADLAAGDRRELAFSGRRTEAAHWQGEKLSAAGNSLPGSDENLWKVAELLPPGYYAAWLEAPLFYSPGIRPADFIARHLVIGKYNLSAEESR